MFPPRSSAAVMAFPISRNSARAVSETSTNSSTAYAARTAALKKASLHSRESSPGRTASKRAFRIG